jgi:hypothetical protein
MLPPLPEEDEPLPEAPVLVLPPEPPDLLVPPEPAPVVAELPAPPEAPVLPDEPLLPEDWAMARPMLRAAARAMRVLFMRVAPFLMELAE